jgi:hypothetical protein
MYVLYLFFNGELNHDHWVDCPQVVVGVFCPADYKITHGNGH